MKSTETFRDNQNQEISFNIKNQSVTDWDMVTLFFSRNHMEGIIRIKKEKKLLFNSEFLILTSLVQVQSECETLGDDGMQS
jgi:hypothetical protein